MHSVCLVPFQIRSHPSRLPIRKHVVMEIHIVHRIDPTLSEAIGRLLPQLNPGSGKPSDRYLQSVIQSSDTRLFIAVKGEQVVGMLTLVFSRLISGSKAWIEDVVTDQDFRNQGIATALLQQAIDTTRQEGIDTLCLTSNPSRTAARTLYRKIGFNEYDTGVFKMALQTSDDFAGEKGSRRISK